VTTACVKDWLATSKKTAIADSGPHLRLLHLLLFLLLLLLVLLLLLFFLLLLLLLLLLD
jgi:hypothetical protein